MEKQMISVKFLDKKDFSKKAKALFAVLHINMSKIAPTDNTYEKDFEIWFAGVSDGLKRDSRKIVTFYQNTTLIGFFQYYVKENTLVIEEFQLLPKWQKKGKPIIELYRFMLDNLPQDIEKVESYTVKENTNSLNIQKKMGLTVTKEISNNSGDFLVLQGSFADVLEKFNRKP